MVEYQVGIIGTGFGAKVQVPAMTADDNYHVAMIAGTQPGKTEAIASSLGIEKHTTNWKDLLEKGLDLIVVTTPPYLHFPMAKAILEADINLLLEKPTTSTAFEAKQLYRLATSRNLVGMMSHEFRWLPERAYLHDLIQSGEIGKLREIYLTQYMNFGASAQIKQFGWFWDSLYEGGIIGAVGSHLVDWIRFLAADEFASVQGGIQTLVKQKTDENGIKHRVSADTGFNFNFDMESGTFGSMTVSSTIHHPPSSKLVIGGDNGTIIFENGIKMAKEGEELKELTIPDTYQLDLSQADKDRRIPPYMKLLQQLTQSLEQGKSLSPNLYDGWKNQQVLDAVKMSHSARTSLVD